MWPLQNLNITKRGREEEEGPFGLMFSMKTGFHGKHILKENAFQTTFPLLVSLEEKLQRKKNMGMEGWGLMGREVKGGEEERGKCFSLAFKRKMFSIWESYFPPYYKPNKGNGNSILLETVTYPTKHSLSHPFFNSTYLDVLNTMPKGPTLKRKLPQTSMKLRLVQHSPKQA